MKEKCRSFSTCENRIFIVSGLAIAAALLLTVVSFIQLCTQSCADAHDYRLLGVHFEIVGFLFFGALAVIHLLSRVAPFLSWVVEILFGSALGAEIVFILVQKNQIGKWCPVCIAIAVCVFIGAAALGVGRVKNIKALTIKGNKGEIMKSIGKGFVSMSAIWIGCLIAFFGIAKYDPLEAARQSIKQSLAFGKKDSPIEVYLFTDWMCQACRSLEPSIEGLSQEIMNNGKLIFVDVVDQPETLNFVPYNLAFMLKNKPRYFQLRHLLTEISKKTGSPTDKEISSATEKLGIQYQKLNYSDIVLGIKYFKKLGEKFKIKGTPTMVIINTKAKKGKKLVGTGEINQDKVAKAIEALKQL
ncbi:MAG: thioredoxin domain-containing protein [Waddliaceae bacterium]